MEIAQRHYKQLHQLQRLVDDPEGRARKWRIVFGVMLILVGIVCMTASGWLVALDTMPWIAILLGGMAGGTVAAGGITLLGEAVTD